MFALMYGARDSESDIPNSRCGDADQGWYRVRGCKLHCASAVEAL